MTRQPRSRLPALLLVLAAVGLVRWIDPIETLWGRARADLPASSAAGPVDGGESLKVPSPTVERPGLKERAEATDPFGGTRNPDEVEIRDLFAARAPTPSPPPPRQVPVSSVSAVSLVPSVQPPEATPLAQLPQTALVAQVIGLWLDGRGLSAFVGGANGVVMARAGDELMGQYTVVQVNPRQLVLRETSSGSEVIVPVPASVPALNSR